jgi:hypothetical protein
LQHNLFVLYDIPNQRGKGNRATDLDLFNIAGSIFLNMKLHKDAGL